MHTMNTFPAKIMDEMKDSREVFRFRDVGNLASPEYSIVSDRKSGVEKRCSCLYGIVCCFF